MYMVIRRYRLAKASVQEAADRTKEAGLPELAKIPGFIDYYYVHSDGSVMAVNFYETREDAERSTQVASEWVRANIPDLYAGPPEVFSGDVLFHRHLEEKRQKGAA